MRSRANQIISYLFHPILMPSLTFIIVFFSVPQVVRPLTLITLPFIFITTCIIPIISISMLKFSGSITSFRLAERKERIMPFLFVSMFYGITTYMFIYQVRVNPTVGAMFVATTILILVLTLITTQFKISIHTAGVAGVVGFLIVFGIKYPGAQTLYPLLTMIVIAGFTMSARLQLNAHTPREILAGALVGLGICFGTLTFFV